MKLLTRITFIGLLVFTFIGLKAEEIRLYNDTYLYGSVIDIKDNMLNIKLASGESKMVPMEEIIVIHFLGRVPLSLQTGSQEFRYIDGSRIRAMIDKNEGDTLFVKSYAAGNLKFDISKLRGFVSLPMSGFVGSKADEMVDRSDYKNGLNLDYALTQNTALYRGLFASFDRANLMFDHEDFLMSKELKVTFLAAGRLADSARAQATPWDGSPQIRLWTRDGSVMLGKLEDIRFGKWIFKPRWADSVLLEIPVDEIVSSEIMGGRIQYLSQLEPSTAKEETLLAPFQPYRMDKNCQGGRLSIAGKRYPWGIGVHANSELTFDLRKKFKLFKSEVGIDSIMGKRGSVVFIVKGDGKELYKSPIVKGDQPPLSIEVNTEGVDKLTLIVNDGGDLDMGDAANWVSARVVR